MKQQIYARQENITQLLVVMVEPFRMSVLSHYQHFFLSLPALSNHFQPF